MQETNNVDRKNKRLVTKLVFFVILMGGFGFALVPIYNVLCKATGLNGKIDNKPAELSSPLAVDNDRFITVQFVSTINGKLPWQFRPDVTEIKVHPGESRKITFFAENDSSSPMTVQAIPSITPGLAAKYLKKTQCFCFTQQTLAAGKKRHMPMIFHIDPALPKNFNEITVSYTLFDATGIKPSNNPHQGTLGS